MGLQSEAVEGALVFGINMVLDLFQLAGIRRAFKQLYVALRAFASGSTPFQ